MNINNGKPSPSSAAYKKSSSSRVSTESDSSVGSTPKNGENRGRVAVDPSLPPKIPSRGGTNIRSSNGAERKRTNYDRHRTHSGTHSVNSGTSASVRSGRSSGGNNRSRKGSSSEGKTNAGKSINMGSSMHSRKSSQGSRKVEVRLGSFNPKNTVSKIIVILLYAILVAYTAMVLFGPLVLLSTNKDSWCNENDYSEEEENEMNMMGRSSGDEGTTGSEYENPDYITDPCRYKRLPELLYLTLEECDLSRRLLASVVFGGAIGYERRSSDRPAGIRTMGLVSLGSCFFTISSQLAFKSSTMGWDASRVTAAIPSGVGFLGAGLIWKGTVGVGDDQTHQVHGLTTAASVWLSAAIGCGAGGALYALTAYSTVLVVFVLRYGPKLYLQEQDDEYYEEEEENTYDDTEEEDFSDYPTGGSSGPDDDQNREKESDDSDKYKYSFHSFHSSRKSEGGDVSSEPEERTALIQASRAFADTVGVDDDNQNGANDTKMVQVTKTTPGGEGEKQGLLQDIQAQQQSLGDDYFYGSLSPPRDNKKPTISSTGMEPPPLDSGVDFNAPERAMQLTPPQTPNRSHQQQPGSPNSMRRRPSATKLRTKSPNRRRQSRRIPTRPSFHN